MLARHDRQVVLAQGAIPGERVLAWVERVERQLALADTVDVLEPSADRQSTDVDPASADVSTPTSDVSAATHAEGR